MNNSINRIIDAKVSSLVNRELYRKRIPLAGKGIDVIIDNKKYLNFSSNDYLGLGDGEHLEGVIGDLLKKHGVGSKGSPLVSGYRDIHLELEEELCKATSHEAALIFNSGFSANVALMQLFVESNLVVVDKLIHASMIDGLLNKEVKFQRFMHNDVPSATSYLLKKPEALVTESLFSMDGDQSPIHELGEVCHRTGTMFVIDDAHGFGVIGDKGIGASFYSDKIDLQVITFGKALGGQGAAILSSKKIIDYLVTTSREYIYSTALSPLSASIVLFNLKTLQSNSKYLSDLQENIKFFRNCCKDEGVKLLASTSPIQILIVPMQKMKESINYLKENGIWAVGIRPPTVHLSRIRFTITSLHTKEQLQKLASLLKGLG